MRRNYLIILISSILLQVLWFWDRNIMATGESGLLFYNIQRHSNIVANAWTYPAFGNVAGIQVAAYPTYYFLSFIESYIVSGYILQALVFGLLLFASGIFVCKFSKLLFPKVSIYLLLLPVVFYWFNPFSLVSIWNRFLYNYMFFWALIPILSYFFVKGLIKKSHRYTTYSIIACLVLSYSYTSLVFVLLTFLVILLYTVIFLVQKRTTVAFAVKNLFLFAFLFLITNAWWLSQLIIFVSSGSSDVVVSSFFEPIDNLSTLNFLSDRLGKIGSLLRLKHADFYTSSPQSMHYLGGVMVGLLEFIILGLVLIIAIKDYKKRNVYLLLSFFVVIIFLSKGSNYPFGSLYEYIFKAVPPLQIFRNPYEKFLFIAPAALAPLIAYSIDSIGKKVVKYGFTVITLVLFFAWSFPFFTSIVFSSIDLRGNSESYDVIVPDDYKKINDKIDNSKGRMVVVPIANEGITFNWDERYVGVEPSSVLYDIPNISFITTIPYYAQQARNLQKYQLSDDFIQYLLSLDVRYILLRKDINFRERDLADYSTLSKKYERYVKEDVLQEIATYGDLSLFEIESYKDKKIYTSGNCVYSNSGDYLEIKAYANELNCFFNISAVDYGSRHILFPTSTFEFDTQNDITNYSDQNLLDNMPSVRHFPSDKKYPLVLFKERLTYIAEKKGNKIDLLVGLLGKRSSEMFLSSNRDDYMKSEDLFKMQFQNFVKTYPVDHRDISSNNTIHNKLFMILELLVRSGSSVSNEVEDYLKQLGYLNLYDLDDGEYLMNRFQIPAEGIYNVHVPLSGKTYYNGELIDSEEVHLDSGTTEIAIDISSDFSRNPEIDIENVDLYTPENSPSVKYNVGDIPEKVAIEIDYKFKKGESFMVLGIQDIDDRDYPQFSRKIQKNSEYHDWTTARFMFYTTPGAKTIEFSIASSVNKVCKEDIFVEYCSEFKSDYEVEVSRFSVEKVIGEPVALVSKSNVNSDLLEADIEVAHRSYTEYIAKVKKHTDNPEKLILSELYDPNWVAYYDNGKVLAKSGIVNEYANSWVLDRDGEYEVFIKYRPQKYYRLGLIISLVSLFVVICLSWIRR